MTTGSPPENPGWIDLTDTFTDAGLPLPPIPEPLRTQLSRLEDWCWSTRAIDPFDMYAFDHPPLTDKTFLADILLDRVADYAAVSHSGHGLNSYGLNFHLVHERLAILMQVGWGGVYMDNAERARELDGHWARISYILNTPPGPDTPRDQRLLLVYSSFRVQSGCSWIARPAVNFDLAFGREAAEREDPFDTAVRLWSPDD